MVGKAESDGSGTAQSRLASSSVSANGAGQEGLPYLVAYSDPESKYISLAEPSHRAQHGSYGTGLVRVFIL